MAVTGDEHVYLKGKRFVDTLSEFYLTSLVLCNHTSEMFWKLKSMQGGQK